MIESSKYNRENYPRKHFWTQERETGVKFNPGLSANRPSNNRARRLGPDVFAGYLSVEEYWDEHYPEPEEPEGLA